MRRTEVARRLASMLRPLAPLMGISVGCRLVNQGLSVAIPALAAGAVVGIATTGRVGGMVALLSGLGLVKGLFRYLEQFTGHAVAFRLLSRLRVEVYRHLIPLAPAGLEDERSGDLVARVIGDVDRVEPFFAHTIAPFAGALAVPALAAGGLALWVDPVLGLVFLPFPLVIALVVPWLRASRVAATASRIREEEGATAALLTEATQGRRELRIFDAQRRALDRLAAAGAGVARLRRYLARIAAARTLIADLLAAGAVVAVAWAASSRFEAGDIDLPALAAAVVVAWVGTTPARALEDVVADLEQALAAAARLFQLADRTPPVPEGGAGIEARPHAVGFRQVSVTVGGEPVLAEVDAEVEAGSLTAVVGPSGSGKSTLVGLLVRFRDPDGGRVELGGVDLRTVDPAALRRVVTLVPQRPDLFYGTLRENLVLAVPDAGDDRLWAALARVGLDTWVRSLPAGLETRIGELGDTISGGQRQRVSLARALLRDTPVLVLDEATSELDPEAEAVVMASLRADRGRRTMIMVAHRIDTVAHADRILVLDRGRLVEAGTHDRLVTAEGVYAGLWRRHQDVLV